MTWKELTKRRQTMRLIDVDELLKDGHQHYDLLADEYYILVRDVEDAPTIEERKRGKWIKRGASLFRCSECGRFSPTKENFCPKCGADMRGEDK